MKTRIILIASILTGSVIMSNNSCNESSIPEDNVNTEIEHNENIEGQTNPCSENFNQANGTWIETYAGFLLEAYTGFIDPGQFEADLICEVKMFVVDSGIYFAYATWEDGHEPNLKELEIYNCNKELVESETSIEMSDLITKDTPILQTFYYSRELGS